jgi:hypothetical protein
MSHIAFEEIQMEPEQTLDYIDVGMVAVIFFSLILFFRSIKR